MQGKPASGLKAYLQETLIKEAFAKSGEEKQRGFAGRFVSHLARAQISMCSEKGR